MGQRNKTLLLAGALALVASPLWSQYSGSGDISSATAEGTTLGAGILKFVLILAGFAFVGLIVYGGLTLATNRPKGLACIGGGLFGALLAGLAFILVQKLTGQSIVLSMLSAPGSVFLS